MKNFLNKIWNWLNETFEDFYNFFLSLILGKSPISIKKVLSFLTFFLVTYLAIFTEKDYYELLIFLAALLGLRSYDKLKYGENAPRKTIGFKTVDNNINDDDKG